MKKLIALILLTGIVLPCRADIQIGRIKISSPDEIRTLRQMGFSIYHDEVEGVVDLLLNEFDLTILKDMGYQPDQLTPYIPRSGLDLDPEYHTYEELTEELQNLSRQYPELCKLDSIGRATQFERTIWCMKLSDNAWMEEDEMALFYFGTHHGNEPVGGETILYMINHFLENYGLDPEITGWMDNYEIFFVPFVNPDGHYAVTSGINDFWRKNARDINNNGIYYEFFGGTWWTDDHEGIDLNRNYNWHWELGGSSDPWAYDYRGEYPFSESELQGIDDLGRQQRFVCGISFHSYGEVVIYPWTYNGLPAPDQDVLQSIATGLASRFIKDNGTPYYYEVANGRNGQCRNWFYGFGGAAAYCLELNPYPVFLPPGSQLIERTQRYYEGAIYLLERLSGPGITGHVRDAITGLPLGARVEIQGRISDQVKPRFADPGFGRFTRLLNNGTYTVLCGMPGYQTVRIQNVIVNNTMTELEIQLAPTSSANDEFSEKISPQKVGFQVVQSSENHLEFLLDLPHSSMVDLRLYNIQGCQVARIATAFQKAGGCNFHYNTSHLSSGVYFARLSTGEFSETWKILIAK